LNESGKGRACGIHPRPGVDNQQWRESGSWHTSDAANKAEHQGSQYCRSSTAVLLGPAGHFELSDREREKYLDMNLCQKCLDDSGRNRLLDEYFTGFLKLLGFAHTGYRQQYRF